MAKKTEPKEKKNTGRISPQLEKARTEVYRDLFELKKRFIEHIKWSLGAIKPCAYCGMELIKNDKGEVVEHKPIPGKAKNEKGNCKFCDAAGYIPNETQRNWAADRIGDRIAPIPKTIEVSDESGKLQELNNEALEKLPTSEIEAMLAEMEQKFGKSTDEGTSQTTPTAD